MTTKTDFTPEEWKLITGLPWAIGLAVILAEDKGGRKATKKELAALERAPALAAAQFAGSVLVQAALPDVAAHTASDRIKEYSREKGDTEQAIYQDTFKMCQQAAAILAAKTPFAEQEAYRRFVLEIGRRVADAAVDAEFLGIGGGTISAYERKILRAFANALGQEEED